MAWHGGRGVCSTVSLGVQQRNIKALHTLRWRHNDHAGVSNHLPHGCLLNRLFRRKSKKTSKLRVTGLCAGHSPGTGEFPAQMASYAENVSIWWRHHELVLCDDDPPVTVGRWNPLAKGQWRGKRFHVITSSCCAQKRRDVVTMLQDHRGLGKNRKEG